MDWITLTLAVAVLIAILDKARTCHVVKTMTFSHQHLASAQVDLLEISDNLTERLDKIDERLDKTDGGDN